MFDTHAPLLDDHRSPSGATPPLATRQGLSALAEGVLEASSQGVAVLDARARLIYWNGEARQRLGRAGWTVDEGRLHARRCADETALLRALKLVCGSGKVCLLNLADDGGETAALKPMAVDAQRCATLVLGREALCGAVELQLFASRSALTLAESRVLQQLVRGARPAQIAKEHGVALSTVLTQVAALRSKTQCTNIHHLLAQLSRLPVLGAVR